MPIFPMDGGQTAQCSILGPKRKKATHIISIVAAVALGLLALQFGFFIGAIFMGFFAYQNIQFLQGPKQA